MNVADVLNKAADLIEPEGAWQQFKFGSREVGCYCIMGALHQTRWDCNLEFGEAVYRPAKFLESFLGESPALWNDAPERTQSEVVAKLREAALLAHREKLAVGMIDQMKGERK